MYKRGVITDEISQDPEVAIRLAMQYGLDGVEIRSVWEKGPQELDRTETETLRSAVRAAGLEVPAISSPLFKCSLDDPEEIRRHLDDLEHCIRLAHMLEARFIRGFTFWRGREGLEDRLERILAQFETPVRRMEQEGLVLVLESDPGVSATNAAALAKVLAGIDSPQVRGLWDPGNDIHDPFGETPYPDGYGLIRPWLAHVHFKDAVRQTDGTVTGVPVGSGDVDWESQFLALSEDGYDGYVVLETHYRPNRILGEAMLALPKGAAFSLHGEEATEACLRIWQSRWPVSDGRGGSLWPFGI